MAVVISGLASTLAVMTTCWLASLTRRNAGYVDRAWGALFPVLAAIYLIRADEVTPRAVFVAVLASVWGARLAIHLTVRAWGTGEEWRHQEARARNPWFPLLSLVTLFWPQAVAAVAVSTPLLASLDRQQPSGLQPLDVIGGAVWLGGLLCEAVADRQLRRFGARTRDRTSVLDRGLWRYSRHPNYFGDALMWWGLGVIGLTTGHIWSIAGPAGMTVVLLYGSGVRAMDQHMLATRGDAYAAYASDTSAFLPLPPRRTTAP